MVGIRRYVHIAFAVAGILFAYLLTNIFVLIGGAVGWSTAVLGFDIWSIVAITTSTLVTIAVWRNESVFTFVYEVAEELKKVTWPTYEETRNNTWVVVSLVAIFAVGLGIYDFVINGITNAIIAGLQ